MSLIGLLKVIGLAKHDGDHQIDTSMYDYDGILYIDADGDQLYCVTLQQIKNMQPKSLLKIQTVDNNSSPLV